MYMVFMLGGMIPSAVWEEKKTDKRRSLVPPGHPLAPLPSLPIPRTPNLAGPRKAISTHGNAVRPSKETFLQAWPRGKKPPFDLMKPVVCYLKASETPWPVTSQASRSLANATAHIQTITPQQKALNTEGFTCQKIITQHVTLCRNLHSFLWLITIKL